jgi:phage-related protein
MSFFNIGEFFGKVGDAARSVGNTIGSAVSSATDAVVGTVSNAVSGIGGIASAGVDKVQQVLGYGRDAVVTVYNDAKDLIKTAPDRFAGAAGNIIGSGGDALANIGSSLVVPLTVAAAGLTAVFLFKK